MHTIDSELFFAEISQFFHSQSVHFTATDCSFSGVRAFYAAEKNLLIAAAALVANTPKAAIQTELTNVFSPKKFIWLDEDVWHTKRKIAQSRLQSALGTSRTLPARVTQIRRIDKPTADAFLTENHLQGSPSAKLKYGLFLPERYYRLIPPDLAAELKNTETLLMVGTFGAAKTYHRNGRATRSIELVRVASHNGLTIVGGMDKLLKTVEREHQPDDLMTYVDADWSDGSSFERIGFRHTEHTPPLTFYVHFRTFKRQRQLPPDDSEAWISVTNSGSWKMLREKAADGDSPNFSPPLTFKS